MTIRRPVIRWCQHLSVRGRPSFTLIELLVSLSLAALLVTITGRIAVQTIVVRDEALRIVQRLEREAVIVQTLSTDLRSLLTEVDGSETPLSLKGVSLPVLRLHVLTPIASADGSLHVARRPATVHYRLINNRGGSGGFRLVREVLDKADPRKVTSSEDVATRLAAVTFAVYHAGDWTGRYPPDRGDVEPVVLLRLAIRWIDSDTTTMRLLEVSDAN